MWSVARGQGGLNWMADYFPRFADEHTVALWLFDETPYAYNTLTDAGIYEYDLRLFEGILAAGKFGNALKTSPGSEYNAYYAEWAGKVCKERMRRPKGEPSGLWGPTIAPEKILAAAAGGGCTIEFWVKFVLRASGESVIIDMGHAYDTGMKIVLEAGGSQFRIENAYGGYTARCSTNSKSLFDGQWHHVAFTCSAGNNEVKHYLDGREQGKASITATAKRPVPRSIIPSSFVRPEGYEAFDTLGDVKKYRLHRFNLSLGENRHGVQDVDAMLDEFRISDVIRYSGEFSVPGSFSRNYGGNAPERAAADGPALLFAADSARGVVQLGSRKHMFIDDVLLDSKHDVRLVCNAPGNRQELNFWPDASAWRPSVVDVDGKVFMYAPESYGSDKGNTHLRISGDGLNFSEPKLGLYEYEGKRENDFVISMRPLYGNFFKDTRSGIRPEEKYKMMAWLSNRGIYLYISPDGLHWRRNETAMLPIISGGDAETYWDDQRGVYSTFLRRDTGHYTAENPGSGRAALYFESSEVFKTWPFRMLAKPYFHTFSLPCPTGEGPTIFKENETGQVYRTRAIKYPWAPDVYVSFPWRYRAEDQTRRVDLGVSRDGLNWKFYAGQQWYMVPPEGSDEVLSMYGLIRRGDEIWQYMDEGGAHGSTAGRTKARVYSRVIQRLDGFVSLDAGKTAGTAVTRPLIFEGDKLTLNAAAGRVLVEIEDENGKAIDGFSLDECDAIESDSIRHVVLWKGSSNLSRLSGKTVRLKFEMRETKLFALQFCR